MYATHGDQAQLNTSHRPTYATHGNPNAASGAADRWRLRARQPEFARAKDRHDQQGSAQVRTTSFQPRRPDRTTHRDKRENGRGRQSENDKSVGPVSPR